MWTCYRKARTGVFIRPNAKAGRGHSPDGGAPVYYSNALPGSTSLRWKGLPVGRIALPPA